MFGARPPYNNYGVYDRQMDFYRPPNDYGLEYDHGYRGGTLLIIK